LGYLFSQVAQFKRSFVARFARSLTFFAYFVKKEEWNMKFDELHLLAIFLLWPIVAIFILAKSVKR
jgi:hypothetical protein